MLPAVDGAGSWNPGYDKTVSKPAPKNAEWWQHDAERNERVRRARLCKDSSKPPGRNLEKGSDLVRFAHEFAAAFEKARLVVA